MEHKEFYINDILHCEVKNKKHKWTFIIDEEGDMLLTGCRRNSDGLLLNDPEIVHDVKAWSMAQKALRS